MENAEPSRITATALFSSVLHQVSFEREGEPVALSSYDIPMTFAQPNNEPRVEKVLLDPTYFEPAPPSSDPDDFTVRMRVDVAESDTPYSSFSLCSWEQGKTTAECAVEDDGGVFTILVLSRGQTLQTSSFVIRLSASQDHHGFYIGIDEEGEPDSAILVRTKAGDVNVPILFD
ncbi:hypothetical protein [Sphingomonas sp.]|uniref:hypothetical protein n=1 Tax=Sphingomonas sp. TaxID=28214 RepID=UPI00180B0E1B|nr:hypothetical protein [Sphingomonas sp.]MBA3512315.1 hypothetical protein [Sphingomonas sp.]